MQSMRNGIVSYRTYQGNTNSKSPNPVDQLPKKQREDGRKEIYCRKISINNIILLWKQARRYRENADDPTHFIVKNRES
jgi:hypothetical protein